MDEKANRLLHAAADTVDTHCNILKYQVLNNLDAVLFKSGSALRAEVDKMVKGPLMRSVAQIQHAREQVLTVLREGKEEKRNGS